MAKKRKTSSSSQHQNAAITTLAGDRKARRKEERRSKKRNYSGNRSSFAVPAESETKAPHKNKLSNYGKGDCSSHVIKNNDDENENQYHDCEIAESDGDLHIVTKKAKKRSKKKTSAENVETVSEDEYFVDKEYHGLDAATASALRAEDSEIAELERKLGLSDTKKKKKLHREYSKLEGFGDDFGDFLDGLDDMIGNVLEKDEYFDERSHTDSDKSQNSEDEPPEETIPMKEGSPLRDDEDYSDEDSSSSEESEERDKNESEDIDYDDMEAELNNPSKDHVENDTYQPRTGQDIYGNSISQGASNTKPGKYIPPQLRNKVQPKKTCSNINDNDDIDKAQRMEINRAVKGILNRLSDSTLESTLQQFAKLYQDPKHSNHLLNETLCSIVFDTIAVEKQLMEKLIPLNAALIVGLHSNAINKDIGSYVLESLIAEYSSAKHRMIQQEISETDNAKHHHNDTKSAGIFSKQGSNLILFLCYLYNFHLVECELLYDIIRILIESFREIDVEVLLLILQHAGKELRRDDPSALRDIVVLVNERALVFFNSESNCTENQAGKNKEKICTRVKFMMDAMVDLKNNNNKRLLGKNSNLLHAEEKMKTYRKTLGRIKSNLKSTLGGGSDGGSLRICLQDIMDIPTKGRWWKTGASWLGNQASSLTSQSELKQNVKVSLNEKNTKQQDKLLRLASAARMNTEIRKSIFCIIMSSTDCEDAFAKLIRQQILASSYSEVGRVTVECCLQEKSYNPFYAYLGLRLCEFQKKCKRGLGKVISDVLQRFMEDEGTEKQELGICSASRQAANLAKLSSHWVREGVLKLKILESVLLESDIALEASEDSILVIFLAMFFQQLLDTMDIKAVKDLFSPRNVLGKKHDEEEIKLVERDEQLRQAMLAFLMKYLCNSPKNKKGSLFRTNLKIAMKCCETELMDF